MHIYIYIAFFVVLFQLQTTIDFATIININFEYYVQCINKVINIVLVIVLDVKVVNSEAKNSTT